MSFTGALLFEVLNVSMLNTRFYEKTTLLIGPLCNVNIRSLPVAVFNVQDAKNVIVFNQVSADTLLDERQTVSTCRKVTINASVCWRDLLIRLQ